MPSHELRHEIKTEVVPRLFILYLYTLPYLAVLGSPCAMTEKLLENFVDLESRARLPKLARPVVTFLTAVNIILRYESFTFRENKLLRSYDRQPHPSET